MFGSFFRTLAVILLQICSFQKVFGVCVNGLFSWTDLVDLTAVRIKYEKSFSTLFDCDLCSSFGKCLTFSFLI